MDLAQRLEEEVARHNELVDLRDQHQQAAAQAEAERQVVRGRIEVLNELANGDDDEDASKEEPSPE